MSTARLPDRASLEYLRKLAKEHLKRLRVTDPNAKLADAQLAIARQYGFASWRALKAELDRRAADDVARFFDACAGGDTARVRELLAQHRTLATAADARRPHGGWTALHAAAFAGHADIVRLLLEHGADPQAREAGDETTALHWAAARGDLPTIQALLDAGADARGAGDVHELEVIGWATVFRSSDEIDPPVISLLIDRGARHHIFSAIALADSETIREVVRQDPSALERRQSRFEHGRSALHFAIERKRLDLLELLIELGADVNATDLRGQTPLEFAIVRGDWDSARRLQAAGAESPSGTPARSVREPMAVLARATRKGVPMIGVPDIAAALAWYTSIGFTERGRHADDGLVNWGWVSFGEAELMFGIHPNPDAENVRLWFYTAEVDRLYQLLVSRQLDAAQAAMTGEARAPDGIRFVEDLYDPFYGGRQFSIADPYGYTLIFYRE